MYVGIPTCQLLLSGRDQACLFSVWMIAHAAVASYACCFLVSDIVPVCLPVKSVAALMVFVQLRLARDVSVSCVSLFAHTDFYRPWYHSCHSPSSAHYKARWSGQPAYLSNSLHEYLPTRNLRSASSLTTAASTSHYCVLLSCFSGRGVCVEFSEHTHSLSWNFPYFQKSTKNWTVHGQLRHPTFQRHHNTALLIRLW